VAVVSASEFGLDADFLTNRVARFSLITRQQCLFVPPSLSTSDLLLIISNISLLSTVALMHPGNTESVLPGFCKITKNGYELGNFVGLI